MQPKTSNGDELITDEEISRFEMRVMSVGCDTMSDSQWRRLIDTLEYYKNEAKRLHALAYGCPDCGVNHKPEDCTTLHADNLKAERDLIAADARELATWKQTAEPIVVEATKRRDREAATADVHIFDDLDLAVNEHERAQRVQ